MQGAEGETEAAHFLLHSSQCIRMQLWLLQKQQKRIKTIKSGGVARTKQFSDIHRSISTTLL